MRLVLVALASLAAAGGCSSRELAPAAIDYRAGPRTIEIRELADAARGPAPEPRTFYNTKTEEGRREGARVAARKKAEEASFTYALAHNVAVRLAAAEEDLRAAGLARPVVLVVTRADPSGVVATGSRAGASFRVAPEGAPPDPVVRISGAVDKSLVTALIEQGAVTERLIFTEDSTDELVARLADALVPTARELPVPESPLGFVRGTPDENTIAVAFGLEEPRTLHVKRIVDTAGLDGEGAKALLHHFVRIRFQGGPEPPARHDWIRVEVEEAR